MVYKKIETLTYEEALNELEQITQLLEAGDRSLEESLDLFERGQALVKHCNSLLDHASLRIQQLDGDQVTDLPAAE